MSASPDPLPRKKGLDAAVNMLGLVCVVLLVMFGLAVVGFFVFMAVGMSNFGSNK